MSRWTIRSHRATMRRSWSSTLPTHTRRTLLSLLPLLVSVVSAMLRVDEARAQTGRKLSVQASGLFAEIYGANYVAMKGGFGGEAQLRYTPGALSFGGGVQYTRHNNDAGEELSAFESSIELLGVFVEPRYVIYVGSDRIAPYAAARVAFTTLETHVESLMDPISPSRRLAETPDSYGFTFNGGGGLLVNLNSRMNVDVGATAGFTTYTDGPSVEFFDSTGSRKLGAGTNLIVRVGLALGLGR